MLWKPFQFLSAVVMFVTTNRYFLSILLMLCWAGEASAQNIRSNALTVYRPLSAWRSLMMLLRCGLFALAATDGIAEH
jgi:hypothetical protein